MMKFSNILIFLLLILVNVYSLTEVIIILGCANHNIQKQRIITGLEYIRKSKSEKVLYLSGGIKNDLQDSISESSEMLKQIKNENINSKIIIDEESKNTAQNFVNLKKWINNNKFSDIISYVIVTSDFHINRAREIFKTIFKDINAKYVLSKSDCDKCWDDENIHMKNVKSDIMDALIFIN